MNQFLTLSMEKRCQSIFIDTDREVALQKWHALNVTKEEEEFLSKFLPINPGDVMLDLDIYTTALKDLRAVGSEYKIWSSFEEIDAVDFSDPEMDWIDLSAKFTRTVYLWKNGEFSDFSMHLLSKFEDVTGGDFLFLDFPPAFQEMFTRASLILVFTYFPVVPLDIQMFILRSELLFFALSIGLDLTEAMRKTVNYYWVLADRLHFSRLAETFLLSNTNIIGFQEDGTTAATIKYWINSFGTYSHHKYDSMSLLNFFNEKNIWEGNTTVDKEITREILLAFSFLVGKSFMVEAKNEDIKEKDGVNTAGSFSAPQKIIKIEKNNTEIVDIWSVKKDVMRLSNPEEILSRLQELSNQYNDPDILSWYYFDEQAGEFKWRE